MKLLREFGIILIILFLGEFINKFTGIPIPGNILGMIILLITLLTGILKIEWIDNVAKFLLDHLAFLFIPAGVGMIKNVHLVKDEWLYILIILTISTALVFAVTGFTVQFLRRRFSK